VLAAPEVQAERDHIGCVSLLNLSTH